MKTVSFEQNLDAGQPVHWSIPLLFAYHKNKFLMM